ncbi:MAG: 50S ribosomal protein L20 [Anaerolineae bacterium]|uniref:50S ribosomal protein L20 n=1 Tax=Candidatus Amarolinea dominans TaxID=3140696 RepID=UPI001DDBB523|nr:50S ribosomal protein L20 [Anaerolineae bacterium]MBK7199284.1 50S ribosomal protein L20 [Anaerolineae bacterium]MBK9093399.1 50S ribosomal protein L20 [Anaerolineae bacterium]MBK9230638.1 50S ribosomal protein L20 [Anaerolineae bacterium]
MSRVKRGVPARQRHKKILKMMKGQFGTRHRLFRRANEAMLKSLFYATRDRRNRKRQFRALWITRINAAARQNGLSYSRFVYGLQKAGVDIDRKMMAELAVRDASVFARLVDVAKQSL